MTPEQKARARKILIATGGVTLVAIVGVALWNAIADRPPKFARTVAEDFPGDAVGMIALADPSHSLELLDAGLPDDLRSTFEQTVGFDPLSASSWADRGFDIEAPIGFGVSEVARPVFMISIGLDDAARAREALRESSDELGLGEWQDREFGGTDGLWRDFPPIAVVVRDERMIVVGTADNTADAVEEVAEEVASMRRRDSLAATQGFRNIHRFPGDPIVVGYANVAKVTSSPMAAMTVGSVDVEGMAFALTSDDQDIHVVSQTMFAEDANYLRYANQDRSTRALDRVPGPVYGGIHWSVDPQYLRDTLDELGGFGREGLEEVKRETRDELGLDLEDDLFAAWSGELGGLWTGAGTISGNNDDWGGLLFAGIRDEAKAQDMLERVWSHTDGRERESTDAGELFIWADRPPVIAKVYDGQIWFGLGDSRIREVSGDAEGFRKTTDTDAIADVVASDSMGIAFVDLNEVREVLREHPDSDRWYDRYADVLDHLEAVTMSSSVDGQTFTYTFTLHTDVDDAFDTLLERLVADIAADASESLLDEIVADPPSQ